MTLTRPQQTRLLCTLQCQEQTGGKFPEHGGALLCSCQLLSCAAKSTRMAAVERSMHSVVDWPELVVHAMARKVC